MLCYFGRRDGVCSLRYHRGISAFRQNQQANGGCRRGYCGGMLYHISFGLGVVLMQIGEPLRTIVVDPLELPAALPHREPEPQAPIAVPERQPEEIPV